MKLRIYNELASRVLCAAYGLNNDMTRRLVLKVVLFLEGGEFYSSTLRKIFARYHGIEIGMYSYGGCFSVDNIPPGTRIGRYCSFARNISILAGNHPLELRSTHPFFYNSQLGYVQTTTIPRTKLAIGNDVWIGYNAVILPSVSLIADGAVIGAGSIVVDIVPPFAVVAGNPARPVRYRFRKETADRIIESQWWNKSIEELAGAPSEFATFLKPEE